MEIDPAKDDDQPIRKHSVDTLLSDDLLCHEKMDLIEDVLDCEFSVVWFDPNEITIELDSEKDSIADLDIISDQVIKTEPPDEELDNKSDIKEVFDEEKVTQDEIVQQIADLKAEIEVKEEIKEEENINNTSTKRNGDVMLTVSKVEETHHPCNPSNDPYHYCTKCSFKCVLPGCGFITKNKNVFQTHQKYVEHQKPSKRTLKNSAKTETNDPKLLRCTYCPYSTNRKEVMKNHIKDCEKKIAVKFQVIANCLECGFILNKNAKTCKKCGWRIGEKRFLPQRSSASNKKIKVEEKATPPQKETATKVSNDKMKKSDQPSPTKITKTAPIKVDKDTISIKCEFCSFKTTQKGTLAAHVLKECKGVLELVNSAENSGLEAPEKPKDPPKSAKIIKTRSSTSSTGSACLEADSTTDDHDFVIKCSFCSFLAKNQDILTYHLRENCENYSKLLNSKNNALVQRGASSPGLWKCGFCPFDANKKITMVEHMKHECPNFIQVCCSKPGLAKCNKCSFETMLRCYLVKHLVNGRCSDNPAKRCNYCPFATRRDEELVTHMMKDCKNFLHKLEKIASTLEKDTDEVNLDSLPRCNNCGFIVRNGTLEAHKRNCGHTKLKILKCKFCNYSNMRADTIIQHAIYECENTKKAARQTKCLKSENLTEEDKLKCSVPECGFTAESDWEISQHLFYTEHLFRCRYCPFEAKTEWPYKAHVWKHEHTGICEFCNKRFKTMSEFNKHMVTHGEENYQCPWCSFNATNHKSICEHKIKCKCRTDDCVNCSFKTTDSYFMNMHKKQCKATDFSLDTDYTEISPAAKLSCHLCDFKSCDDKRWMVKHHASNHGVFQCLIYKCKLCTFRTQATVEFDKHYCKEHPESSRVFECPMCMESVKEIVEYRWHYMQHFTK